MRIFFIIFAGFIFWPLISLAEDINFSSKDVLQGDTVVVSVFNKIPVEATLGGLSSSIFKYRDHYRIVFGVSPDKKPGQYSLKITFQDGTIFDDYINVRKRRFRIVELGIPKELDLTPKALTKELGVIKKSLSPILDSVNPRVFFDKSFGLPLADNKSISSYFGEIRKTGSESIRHLGVDFGAPLGKYVYVINSGVVSRAYEDKVYGKSVIIDHGAGIYSLYLHLNKVFVSQGQSLSKGNILGTVGKTGYATSPHLHFSVKVRGVSVDPIGFVNAFAGQ